MIEGFALCRDAAWGKVFEWKILGSAEKREFPLLGACKQY